MRRGRLCWRLRMGIESRGIGRGGCERAVVETYPILVEDEKWGNGI
jgi:hypothetical protein